MEAFEFEVSFNQMRNELRASLSRCHSAGIFFNPGDTPRRSFIPTNNAFCSLQLLRVKV
jgi:hypothetical protein